MVDLDVGQFFDFKFFQSGSLAGIGQKAIWALVGSFALVMLIKMLQHRIYVRTYELVSEGYVMTRKRYKIAKDKEHKDCLVPMMGGKRLPNFPYEAFQFVRGFPIFGIQRTLSIIKINEYTYKVLYPIKDGKIGQVEYYDTLTWVFMEEYNKCLKKYKKQTLMYWASLLAPSVVILAWAVLVFMGFWVDATVTKQVGAGIAQQSEILATICESCRG